MEDKVFDLMSKIYSEMNSRFNEMNSRFNEINKKLDMKADKSDIVRIEDKLENNSKALLDGYKQTYEKITTLEKTLDNISSKVEKQDVEIRFIKITPLHKELFSTLKDSTLII